VHEWSPQVFVDHHGQTTQFFMPPPVLPINPSLPKEQIIRWTEIYGRANGTAFDRFGWNYYVRDVFDLHYPGYWDSWPSLNGAIGMTYETDGGGYRGYRWARDDGTVLTFRDGIAKHFTASLATLRTTAEHREALLRDYYEFFRSGMSEFAAARDWKRFVIVPGSDPERAARLVEVLLRNDIDVSVTVDTIRVGGAHSYLTGAVGRQEFPAGSYIVDLAQPQARRSFRSVLSMRVADHGPLERGTSSTTSPAGASPFPSASMPIGWRALPGSRRCRSRRSLTSEPDLGVRPRSPAPAIFAGCRNSSERASTAAFRTGLRAPPTSSASIPTHPCGWLWAL
jgi:hypothetical protein